jgi:molybdenum cofactor biosynthesis enzyme MoaA
MNFDPTTFCAAPWFQIRKENNNRYRPCCELDVESSSFNGKTDYAWPLDSPTDYLNSEYAQYLRQNLNQGVQLPECRRCWLKESISSRSLRQTINDTVTNNCGEHLEQTWVTAYFQQKTNFEFDLLVSTDIKVSNLCNFSCAMCSPDDSSQIYTIWQKNQSHPIVKQTLNKNSTYLKDIKNRFVVSDYDYLDMILDAAPKHIKILGGEPLIDKKLLQRLTRLSPSKKSKISLLFVTNGSVDLTEFSKQLSDYKQVNYVVSLDGVGTVLEYIRRGSNWNQIQENILNWNACHRPVDVSFTLQCFNALHVPEFYKWCKTHNLKFSIGMVETPEYLSLKAIPDELRKKIYKKYSASDMLKQDIEAFTQLIQCTCYDKKIIPLTEEFLKWYDPDYRWKHMLPEWQDFFC